MYCICIVSSTFLVYKCACVYRKVFSGTYGLIHTNSSKMEDKELLAPFNLFTRSSSNSNYSSSSHANLWWSRERRDGDQLVTNTNECLPFEYTSSLSVVRGTFFSFFLHFFLHLNFIFSFIITVVVIFIIIIRHVFCWQCGTSISFCLTLICLKNLVICLVFTHALTQKSQMTQITRNERFFCAAFCAKLIPARCFPLKHPLMLTVCTSTGFFKSFFCLLQIKIMRFKFIWCCRNTVS